MKRTVFVTLVSIMLVFLLGESALAYSQANDLILPGGQGTLTSNAYRATTYSSSGNTFQWPYQVSAEYSGSKTVQRIRTTWYGGASLRNSASVNMGVSNSGASAGTSSSWQSVVTPRKYWENSNGATTSSWRSNMIVAPSRDYRYSTSSTINTAQVKLSSDARTFEISAGV